MISFAAGGDGFRLQLLRLVVRTQGVDKLVKLPLKHEVELVNGQADPMVGDSVLFEIVGADLFRPVAAAHHGFAFGRKSVVLFLLFYLLQPGTQHAHRFFAVLDLRLFILHRNDDARRHMCDADSRIRRVHRLAARARGTERVDSKILWINMDVDFIDLGHHRDGDGRRMYSAAAFRDRHSLHAVDAALIFQSSIGALPLDKSDDFLISSHACFGSLYNFEVQSLPLGILRIHPKQIAGEQRRFVPPRTGTDFQK